MKPLNAVAREGVKPLRRDMIAGLSVAGIGSADPSTQAAQCLQSCRAGGASGCSGSWHPGFIPSVSAKAGGTNMQSSMDAAANTCNGRASISSISRNRWKWARTWAV